jgi:hypothetical protein
MKRLSIVAVAVASFLGVGFLAVPSAHAADSTCDGVRLHLYLGNGTQLLDLCLFASAS